MGSPPKHKELKDGRTWAYVKMHGSSVLKRDFMTPTSLLTLLASFCLPNFFRRDTVVVVVPASRTTKQTRSLLSTRLSPQVSVSRTRKIGRICAEGTNTAVLLSHKKCLTLRNGGCASCGLRCCRVPCPFVRRDLHVGGMRKMCLDKAPKGTCLCSLRSIRTTADGSTQYGLHECFLVARSII